jgi:hypothetical protein
MHPRAERAYRRERRRVIAEAFPGLRGTRIAITSERADEYNCIAWAAGNDSRWWQPSHTGGFYWPPDVPNQPTLASYIEAFATLGYVVCDSAATERGYEKVAMYVDQNGVPSHAARQLPSGAWTSKLGSEEDIRHETPQVLEGNLYGRVAAILRRPKKRRP